jgi:hypothetical protein
MELGINVYYDRKNIKLLAKVIYSSEKIERVKVIGRNRSITLESNRPLLLSKGLKSRRINWKLIDGQINNSHLLQQIITTVERHLKSGDM